MFKYTKCEIDFQINDIICCGVDRQRSFPEEAKSMKFTKTALNVDELEIRARMYISNYSYENAVFYADLLLAQDPQCSILSEVHADILLRCDDNQKAFRFLNILKTNTNSLRGRLIFAKRCFVLKQFDEFQKYLYLWTDAAFNEIQNEQVNRIDVLYALLYSYISKKEDAFILASIFETIGNVYYANSDLDSAVKAFNLSLKVDPASISCIETLCDIQRNNLNVEEIIYYISQNLNANINKSTEDMHLAGKREIPDDIDESQVCSTFKYMRVSNYAKRVASISSQETKTIWIQEPLNQAMALSEFLQGYTRAYHALSTYKLDKAVLHLMSSQESVWVRRCHRFELLNARIFYEEATHKLSTVEFEALLNQFPFRIEGVEYFGTALRSKRDIVRLLCLCHQLMVNAPYHPITWLTLGNFMSLIQEVRNAIKLLKRAIQTSNTNLRLQIYGLKRLSTEYLESGQYRKAKNIIEIIYKKDPICCRTQMLNALTSFNEKLYKRAIEQFRYVLPFYPQKFEVLQYLGISLYKIGKGDEAINALQEAVEINSSHTEVVMHLAGVLMMSDKVQRALCVMKHVINSNRTEGKFNYMLAKIYEMQNDDQRRRNALAVSRFEGIKDSDKDLLDYLYPTKNNK